MRHHIANVVTLSRLLMAAAIFVLLGFYQAEAPGGPALLDAALAVFILAGITDVLDGTIARRLGTLSTFGRISDPFVDKVLICGAFAYFAGANFLVGESGTLVNVTGVATWMAVLIFAREILVTGIRGFSESRGQAFSTTAVGKAKMALKSLTIMWILLVVAHGRHWGPWSRGVRDVLIWATVIFTVLSALVYVRRTRRLMDLPAAPPGDAPAP